LNFVVVIFVFPISFCVTGAHNILWDQGVIESWLLPEFVRNLYAFLGQIALLALAGATSGGVTDTAKKFIRDANRVRTRTKQREWPGVPNEGWMTKVKDLAQRGITLDTLLHFYSVTLPEAIPDFDPTKHRTADVVRRSVIPLSAEARSSYAEVLNGGKPLRPNAMVTHNWANLFRDLVAAIVSDALAEDEFGDIANLIDTDINKVREWITKKGKGKSVYWVCAFAVNQHASICGGNPRKDEDPVTGIVHKTCTCGLPKVFNTDGELFEGKSIPCELNKFDDMMAHLAATDPKFIQVIAIDQGFDLFTRAWCMSELAQAHTMGLSQYIKLVNTRALDENLGNLQNIRIEDMQATRPEDVQEILAGIPDKDLFNASLQTLIFKTLLFNWRTIGKDEQAEVIGRLGRWNDLPQRDQIFVERQDAINKKGDVTSLVQV